MASSNWNCEGAVIAKEVWEAAEHASKDVEMFRVGQPAFGGAMRGDDVHSALERQSKRSWIAVFGPDNRQRMFAPGMSQHRQFSLGHSFPKLGESAIAA